MELGTSRPSARAVCRLITNSNLVDCKTGRSAGFAPLRDAAGIGADLTICIDRIDPIAHQAASRGNSRKWYIVGTAWRAAKATSVSLRVSKNGLAATASAAM